MYFAEVTVHSHDRKKLKKVSIKATLCKWRKTDNHRSTSLRTAACYRTISTPQRVCAYATRESRPERETQSIFFFVRQIKLSAHVSVYKRVCTYNGSVLCRADQITWSRNNYGNLWTRDQRDDAVCHHSPRAKKREICNIDESVLRLACVFPLRTIEILYDFCFLYIYRWNARFLH